MHVCQTPLPISLHTQRSDTRAHPAFICYISNIALHLSPKYTCTLHRKFIPGYTQDLLCTCFEPISSLHFSPHPTLALSLSLSHFHSQSHTLGLHSLPNLTAELFDAERDECISKVILDPAAKRGKKRMLLDIQT